MKGLCYETGTGWREQGFVGKIPVWQGKSTLYEKRQSSDYEDFVFCDQQDVKDLKEKAIQLIDTIEKMIWYFPFSTSEESSALRSNFLILEQKDGKGRCPNHLQILKFHS